MLGLTRRWTILAVMVAVIKVILATIASMNYDFIGWIEYASSALQLINAGAFPMFNVYTGPALLFALFYKLWLVIPINHPNFVIGFYYFNPTPEAFLLVLIMKTPILLFDLVTGLVIYALVVDVTHSKRMGGTAFLFWYLNPYNAFMLEIWGSIDNIPAALLLGAVMFGYRRRWSLAGILLFIASALRGFPIFLLPVFLLSSARQGRRAVFRFMFSFFVPLMLSITGVAYIISPSQLLSSLHVSLLEGWAQRIYGFPITAGLAIDSTVQDVPISLFLFLYPVQLYVIGRLWRGDSLDLTKFSLAMLMVFFVSTIHEPYHFIWIVPLLTAYYGVRRDRSTLCLLALLLSSAFIWSLFFTDVTTLGLTFFFIPNYTATLKAATESLSAFRNALMFLYTLFAALFYGIKAGFLLNLNLQSLKPDFIKSSRIAPNAQLGSLSALPDPKT